MPSAYNVAKREVVDAGVDWLTASTTGKSRFKRASSRAEELLQRERDKGNEIRRVTVEGYAGFACGQVFAGALGGTLLTRLSGVVAAQNWKEVYADSTNVSRLDLQATVRYTPHVARVAERVERDVLKRLGDSKRPLDVGLMRSRRKGSTCVIGRRVSDRYARVYDKHRESGNDEMQRCWRWEIEYKRGLAKAQAEQLYHEAEPEALICSTLAQTFHTYGAVRLWPTIRRLDCCVRHVPDSTSTRSLGWLRAGVSKTVLKLLDAGMLPDVLDALGLSQHVTVNPQQPEGDS